MCGINGIFAYGASAPGVDREEVVRTRDWMTKRGPDGFGAWFSSDGRVGLGHRRLAIIDLSENGAQPMTTEDGKLKIVFNGEIYNYRELRRELKSRGVNFRSRTDTEVLLHLYRFDGTRMVERLRGMFAFAIWDAEKGQLFLARDHYGIKPLYYADDGGVFRFASQVKALQAGGAVSRAFDSAGVTGFFLWGSVPEPFTIVNGIRMVPAGSTLQVGRSGSEAPARYWQIGDVIDGSTETAASVPAGGEQEYVREALRDSVNAHMVADVPVGAFLSAGLDSSSIAGLASEVSDAPVKTITLTFDEFQGRELDEFPVAQEIARHLGLEHRARRVDLHEVEEDLPRFLSVMDQPTVDGLNTWFVSKAAAEAGLKVALSGLGGDELLGGYATFQRIPQSLHCPSVCAKMFSVKDPLRALYSRQAARLPFMSFAYAAVLKHRCGYLGAYQAERGLFMPWELPQVLRREFAMEGLERLRELEQEKENSSSPMSNDFARIVELESSRYMRNQLLRDADWTGMAHSLEIRVPMVDRVLTEKIFGLAATGRLGANKAILHKILSKGLPASATNRAKTGFTMPIWRWLNKSPELDGWKSVRALKKANTHVEKRWAYSLFVRMPEVGAVLA